MFLKLIIVFFFAFLLPLFVFLTQVLYGGIEPNVLKDSLKESTIYTRVSSLIINAPVNPAAPQAPDEFNSLVTERFTPTYVQTKTEKLVDDSYVWLTKNGPSPVLSFNEVKGDLLAIEPTLQIQLQEMQTIENSNDDYSAEGSLNEFASDPTVNQEQDALSTLMQSNFTIPVGEYFQVLKTLYDAAKIIHPILGIILLALIVTMVKLSYTTTSRLRWTGAMILTAAIVGFGMVFFNAIAVTNLIYASENSSDNLIATFTPVILEIMNVVFAHFSVIQNYVNIGLAVIGFILVFSANLQQSHAIQSSNTKSKASVKK